MPDGLPTRDTPVGLVAAGSSAPEDGDEQRRAAVELGRLLAEARVIKGLSQSELARRSGLRRELVGRVERAQTDPHLTVLVDLAKGLGWSIGDVVAVFRALTIMLQRASVAEPRGPD